MRQLARRWPILGLISVMILTACGGNPTAATPDPDRAQRRPDDQRADRRVKASDCGAAHGQPRDRADDRRTATAAPRPTAPPAPTVNPADQLQYGVVTHLYYADRQRVMDLVGFGNFDWVRQQVPWKDTEKADHTCGCEELDQIIEAIHSQKQEGAAEHRQVARFRHWLAPPTTACPKTRSCSPTLSPCCSTATRAKFRRLRSGTSRTWRSRTAATSPRPTPAAMLSC